MKHLYLIVLGIFLTCSLFAQKVSNVSSIQDGNKINVTYQITDAGTNQLMNINLYYSLNENPYIGPVQKVTGDIGGFVSGNGTKTVVWDVISELGNLEGNVKFKVEVLPKEEIQIPIVSDNDMKGTVESCILSGSTLNVTFILNSNLDKKWLFSPDNIFFFNEYGEKFTSTSFKWGNDSKSYDTNIYLIKNTPFRITFLFDKVNMNSKIIKALQITDKNNYSLQFRDLPVIKK